MSSSRHLHHISLAALNALEPRARVRRARVPVPAPLLNAYPELDSIAPPTGEPRPG
jgi:hypothetical protein